MIKKDKEIIGVIKFNSSGSAHIYNDDLTDKVYIDKKTLRMRSIWTLYWLEVLLVKKVLLMGK